MRVLLTAVAAEEESWKSSTLIATSYTRESSIKTAVSEDPKFCVKEIDGEIRLDNTHSYYYQVQMQMFICDVGYSDFCVCTFASDSDKENIEFIRTVTFGKNVSQRQNYSLEPAYFLSYWEIGIQDPLNLSLALIILRLHQ